MRNHLLVTAVGEDRPGIVAHLTEVFVKNGANLEESRMAVLGGEFAVIVLVSVESDKSADLTTSLHGLEAEGISVTIKNTQPLNRERFAGHNSCSISITGADHEGIVHRISTYLRDRAINIQSVETGVTNAPETGTPLFSMKATVQVPSSISLADLQKNLNAIGNEECVDVEVQACADKPLNVLA